MPSKAKNQPGPWLPLSPRKQAIPSDRPGAVQGAKRRSGPLTARISSDNNQQDVLLFYNNSCQGEIPLDP